MIVTPEEAGRIVERGGVVIYPTETLYGIGGDPFNRDVVARISVTKGRPEEKGFILLVDEKMVYELSDEISENVEKVLREFWPGPLTVILPARKKFVQVLGEKVAMRISPHPVPRRIISVSGKPLISTSANISGEEPVKDFEQLIKVFKDKVDAFVRGEIWYGEPSTIFDAVEGRIIREGAVKKEDLERLLGFTLR